MLMGYERCSQVEGPGQFSIRGGIVDLFPLTEDYPIGSNFGAMRWIPSEALMWRVSVRLRMEEITLYPATELVIKEGDDKKKALVDTFL